MSRDELRTAWIHALRSGEYPQGQGYLRMGGEYCCLGVLCEVAGVEARLEEGSYYTYEGRSALLPRSVRDLVGLMGDGGESKTGGVELVQMNDEGVPFAEIAAALETGDYWEETFS